jgi:MFS family permease
VKDASAYPVILPDVADTITSTDFIGYLGSAYLLAFGMTYPILGRVHTLVADLSNHRALICLRLMCITTFAAGSICSYCLTTIQSVLMGRVIAGIGAAGAISGITTLLNADVPGASQRLGVSFLSVYAVARIVGPM